MIANRVGDGGALRTSPSLRSRLADIYEMNANRNLPMEGLRGLAVALVFFVHFHALFSSWAIPGSTVFALSAGLSTVGHTGVDLFFLISGYLIYRAALDGHSDYSTFLKRRAQRIYPTFLCVLAIYLVLSGLFPLENKIPAGLTNGIYYIAQNLLLLPGVFAIRPIITVAWSLSYEFLYYLLIPLLLAILALRRWRRRWRMALFGFIGVAALIGFGLHPFRCIRAVMFIPGILLYEALKGKSPGGQVARHDYWVMPTVVIAFMMIYLSSGQSFASSLSPQSQDVRDLVYSAVLFFGFGALGFSVLSGSGPLSRLFSWTPLRWLGNMSYSYYLIHGLALNAVSFMLKRLMPATHPIPAVWWLCLPICFAITWIVATALFVAIEKPLSLTRASKTAVPEHLSSALVTSTADVNQ